MPYMHNGKFATLRNALTGTQVQSPAAGVAPPTLK